jgi:hypothetical protein
VFFSGIEAHKRCKKVVATEKQIADSFANLFSDGIAGGDLTSARTELKKNFDSVGMNTKNLDKYFNALQALISELSHESSSSSEEKRLSEKIQNYVDEGKKLLTSQPGLELLYADPNLRNDKRYDEFFVQYDQLLSFFDQFAMALKQNPANPAVYFNAETAKAYAQFVTFMMEVSKKVVDL